jgi:hypothetical protein
MAPLEGKSKHEDQAKVHASTSVSHVKNPAETVVEYMMLRLGLLVTTLVATLFAATAPSRAADAVPGEIIVRFDAATAARSAPPPAARRA